MSSTLPGESPSTVAFRFLAKCFSVLWPGVVLCKTKQKKKKEKTSSSPYPRQVPVWHKRRYARNDLHPVQANNIHNNLIPHGNERWSLHKSYKRLVTTCVGPMGGTNLFFCSSLPWSCFACLRISFYICNIAQEKKSGLENVVWYTIL